jgi:hypothetical protein
MPFLLSTLHPFPPQVISILNKIHKIFYIQVFTRTCVLIETKFAGDHKFHANWKPQISVKVETPSFPMKWETQVSNSHYNHPQRVQPSTLPYAQSCVRPNFPLHWKDISSQTFFSMSKIPLSYCDDHNLSCCYCCLNCCWNLNQNSKNV